MPNIIEGDPTEIALPSKAALSRWARVHNRTIDQWQRNGIIASKRPYILSDVFENYRNRDEILRAKGKSGKRTVETDCRWSAW